MQLTLYGNATCFNFGLSASTPAPNGKQRTSSFEDDPRPLAHHLSELIPTCQHVFVPTRPASSFPCLRSPTETKR
eukprot:scaffold106_cov246-Pinguiococcus_pyrenoidosus.AAC.13